LFFCLIFFCEKDMMKLIILCSKNRFSVSLFYPNKQNVALIKKQLKCGI